MLGAFTFFFTSLLAMVNPLSAVPMFVSLTQGATGDERGRMLRRGIVASVVILVLFAGAGTLIMQFFGITTTAFRLAGGLIFLASGWEMMHGQGPNQTTPDETRDIVRHHRADISIIPLATPLLAGPGSITMVITLNTRAHTFPVGAALYLAIVGVMLVSWGVLAVAPKLAERLGTTGMNVMTRLFGLLVIAVGMQFLADGLVEVAKRVFSV